MLPRLPLFEEPGRTTLLGDDLLVDRVGGDLAELGDPAVGGVLLDGGMAPPPLSGGVEREEDTLYMIGSAEYVCGGMLLL